MKQLALAFGIMLFAAGCASSGVREASQDSRPFTESMRGYTFDQLRTSASCPKHSAQWKDAEWKELMDAAAACAKDGHWVQVERLGNALAIKEPVAPWGAYFLSLSAESRKDMNRANWMIDLAIKKAPQEGILLYQKGRLQWESGDVKTAQDLIAKAVAANPSLTEAYVLLGKMDLLSDHLSRAKDAFESAYHLNPHSFDALLGLADVQLKKQNWAAAESYLHRAISNNPRSMQAHLQLAQGIETLAKDQKAALTSYKKLKRLAERNELDERPPIDIDQKIKTLESWIAQTARSDRAMNREPSAQGKVSK